MRPAITCLIGIFLAVVLNKVTSYYTHTNYAPVKSLAKSCQTGHATNIIQGFAVGYESTVAAIVVIAVAILLSVLTYAGTPPLHRLRRCHDRYRHAHLNGQHHLHGRLRSGGG